MTAVVFWGLLISAGCTSDGADADPRVDFIRQTTLVQGGLVTLEGRAFGPWAARSDIFVNGRCAHVLDWSDESVSFLMPRGVGTGVRLLVLVRGDGDRTSLSVNVSGEDLPAAAQPECAANERPEPADVQDDEEDMTVSDSSPDLAPPDLAPDVPPDSVPDTPDPPLDFMDTPDVDPVRYVRIDDISQNDIGRNPGADIDAVVLRKPRGGIFYAANVVDYQIAPNDVVLGDPTDTLGEPDAFDSYPALDTCSIREGRASLGGAGYLIVDMDVAIEPGDELTVLEVGACFYAPDLMSLAEEYEVFVSDQTRPDGQWTFVGEGAGPGVFIVPQP